MAIRGGRRGLGRVNRRRGSLRRRYRHVGKNPGSWEAPIISPSGWLFYAEQPDSLPFAFLTLPLTGRCNLVFT